MKGRVLKRPAARRDLLALWVVYAENASIDVADRFLAVAESTLEMLAGHPEAGWATSSSKSELEGLRRFPLGRPFERLLAFYFPLTNGIDVARVVDGARDLNSLFAGSD